MNFLSLLAFTRIPGNAFAFWIRKTLKWSRGTPKLFNEDKSDLFDYLKNPALNTTTQKKANRLKNQFHLESLFNLSTKALYRKNLYLLETLENALRDLDLTSNGQRSESQLFSSASKSIKALDIGSQDWHYVFGLERWLRYHGTETDAAREIHLTGVELDGHGIYSDFHSRKDYALAYACQSENKNTRYLVENFLNHQGTDYNVITLFYPFVTRYHLLLWGLPIHLFSPDRLISKAATITKKNGVFVVYCHTEKEHKLFLGITKKNGAFTLLREGPVQSVLVDFYEAVEDRRFSIWRKK